LFVARFLGITQLKISKALKMFLSNRSTKNLISVIAFVAFFVVGCDRGSVHNPKPIEAKPDVFINSEAYDSYRTPLRSKFQDDISDLDARDVRVLLYESQIATPEIIRDLRVAGASIATVSLPWVRHKTQKILTSVH